MPVNPFSHALRSIRKRFGHAAGESDDALLLERFVAAADESAFAVLVERHGPMVWGTCRRVAGDAHAAEDAFQATWLVLARKANSLKDGGSLPGWLHRVAFRLALAARARPAAALENVSVAAPGPEDEAADKETHRVIDEEVNRLPQKYRLPLVLCFYEGKTQAEAAAELGWPVGTVAGRLARAKDVLHGRLTRRGLAPSIWPLPGLLPAAIPPVAAKAAGERAIGLAAALLAGEARRRWLVGAAGLLLVCVGAAAGLVVRLPPDPLDLVPVPRRFRIAPVEGNVFAVSPDGKWVAAFQEGSVRLFDVRTNREVAALDSDGLGAPHTLLFSPDGKLLVAAGKTETRVWDLASGQPCFRLKGRSSLACFSPTGNVLITSSGGKTHLWDVRSGESVGQFAGEDAVLSPDGKMLATYGVVKTVTWLWEVSSGRRLQELEGVSFPAFHPDSQTVATVGFDAIVRLYNCKTGTVTATLNPHVAVNNDPFDGDPASIHKKRPGESEDLRKARVKAFREQRSNIIIQYHHRMKADTLTIAAERGLIRLREEIHAYGGKEWALHLRPPLFSPDGQFLASPFGKETHLWRFRGGKGEFLAKLEGSPCSFSPDGTKFATTKRLWDVASRKQIAEFKDFLVLFGPDSETFFAHSGNAISRFDARTGLER